ncbi:formate-tetrahydrofolate ligase [Streptococcus pneumoniae]|nr:formate-tetrahydrofolate ligase [Streptococcus pneumoniae]
MNFEKKAQTQIAQVVQNGAPENFEITIRELVPKLGAGFIVALTGDVMTMPGLPKRPAALNMDVESDGTVLGLF